MMKFKRIIMSALVALSFAVPALVPATAGAVSQNGLNCGAELQFPEDIGGEIADCETGEGSISLNDIIQTVINVISIVVGIVAVIMIIIGGFKYITSNGDSGAVSGAKNTILYAIVGLVIVALAQIIVRFVVGQLNNAGAGNNVGGAAADGGVQ